MATYSQDGRPISVTTPLGKDVLLLEEFNGSERISGLFHYRLELLALASTTIAFDKVLGSNFTINIAQPDGSTRYISGVVNRLTQGPQLPGADGKASLIRYRADIVPQLWFLTRNAQSRIFQQLSVPDILKQVLTGLDVSYQIQGTFQPRDYCVQYRETDFAFASRLMEDEGIFYFFTYSSSGHQLVLANTPQSHPEVSPSSLQYETIEGGTRPDDRIHVWEKSQQVRSGKYTLWDYCFEMPDKDLSASQPTLDSAAAGEVTHKLNVAQNSNYELYDFPGTYAGRFDGVKPGGSDDSSQLQNIFQDNTRTVGIRMQQETTPALLIRGAGNCRQLIAGHKFDLANHYNGDGSYVCSNLQHRASIKGAYSVGGVSEVAYDVDFECIPFAVPYRPAQVTPKPTVQGTQSAFVVGPDGQEIFTDQYGRVKVQFHWDRQGQNDANSSCWIRVGTPWAGHQWGMIQIPRIGQEVIVAFEEGDPDWPIIVGSVYNATHMPPYTLPDNITISTLKTRSTLNGTDDNYSELRFDDNKGSELVYFHAEKDFQRVVENNDSLEVGSDQADDGSQTIVIWNNRTENIKQGDDNVTIEKGSPTHSIKKDDSLTVEGKQTITVTGDVVVEVKSGNRSVKVDSGTDTLEA